MAKPAWLTVTPESGSGNGSITNTATIHTGRNVRSGIVTITAAGVAEPKTYTVTQKAKPEFVNFTEGPEMSAPKTGGSISVTGKSNSSTLTYSWVGDNHEVEIPATYTANGQSTNNGEAINGDPGATAEFDTSISFTFPSNSTTEEVQRVLKVATAGGQEAQITIKQAGGDATISIDPEEITLEADGTQVTVTVTSNTTWTVS